MQIESAWSPLSLLLEPALLPPDNLQATAESQTSLKVKWEPPKRTKGIAPPKIELILCDANGEKVPGVQPIVADAETREGHFTGIPQQHGGSNDARQFTVKARCKSAMSAVAPGGRRNTLTEKSTAAGELAIESDWSAASPPVHLPGIGAMEKPSAKPEFPHLDKFIVDWRPPKAEGMHECKLSGYVIEVVSGGSADGEKREIEVNVDVTTHIVPDVEGGCEYSIRIRPIATMERGTKGRILGDWSAVCKLSLPGIAKPAVPVLSPSRRQGVCAEAAELHRMRD